MSASKNFRLPTAGELRRMGVPIPPEVHDWETPRFGGSDAEALNRLHMRLARLEQVVVPIVTREEPLREQAKRLGIHASTLSRRRAKARLEAKLNPAAAVVP